MCRSKNCPLHTFPPLLLSPSPPPFPPRPLPPVPMAARSLLALALVALAACGERGRGKEGVIGFLGAIRASAAVVSLPGRPSLPSAPAPTARTRARRRSPSRGGGRRRFGGGSRPGPAAKSPPLGAPVARPPPPFFFFVAPRPPPPRPCPLFASGAGRALQGAAGVIQRPRPLFPSPPASAQSLGDTFTTHPLTDIPAPADGVTTAVWFPKHAGNQFEAGEVVREGREGGFRHDARDLVGGGGGTRAAPRSVSLHPPPRTRAVQPAH